MGDGQSKLKDTPIPNPKDPNLNRCSDGLGDVLVGSETNLCLYFGNATFDNNSKTGKQFCQSIGVEEEWKLTPNGKPCCTDKNDNAYYGRGFENPGTIEFLGAGGCEGLFNGRYIQCEREKFTADPLTCCFLDHNCFTNPIEDSCFETKNKLRTCSPDYRNLSSTNCLDLVKPYCTGSSLLPGQTNWWEMWVPESGVELKPGLENYDVGDSYFIPNNLNIDPENESRYIKQPCMRALARAMTRDEQFCSWESIQGLDIRRGNYDKEGLRWAQEVVTSIFNRYINQFGSFVGGVNSKGQQIGEMEQVFFDICTKFPVLCQDSLSKICENINTADLADTFRADVWCGCYMPDNEYQKYIDNYQIQKECTPFCNNPATIPNVDSDGYEKICRHDICIIDNLKLNFVRAKIRDEDNKVTFTQLCGGCGGINIDQKITSAQDFNTERILLSGMYSQTILDKTICRKYTASSPFLSLFPSGENIATVTMKSVETGHEILVTFELSSIPVGTGANLISEWSLKFVSSSSLNEDYLFKNGEEMEFVDVNISFPCKLYCITVTVMYGGTHSKYNNGDISISISTRYLFRSRETYGNQCTCIIENSSIDIIDSTFGDLNLYQNCGSNLCTDENNKQIPCMGIDDGDNSGYYPPEEAINIDKKQAQRKTANITAIIIFSIFILFALITIILGFVNKTY